MPLQPVSAVLGVLVIAPVPLDFSFRQTSYAMQYNRLGWTLFALLYLSVAVPPRVALSARNSRFEGIGSGVILALLVFLKVNYLGMSVAVVLVSIVLFSQIRQFLLWIAIGFIGCSVALVAGLHWHLRSYIAELIGLAQIARAHNHGPVIWALIRLNLAEMGLVLLGAALLIPCARFGSAATGRREWVFWGSVFMAATFIPIGILICASNAQNFRIPLFPIGGFVLAELLRRRCISEETTDVSQREIRLRSLLAHATPCVLLLSIFKTDAASIASSFAWKRMHAGDPVATATVDSPVYRGTCFPRQADEKVGESGVVSAILGRQRPTPSQAPPRMTPAQYAFWLSDGVRLLNKHRVSGAHLFVEDWTDPLSFAAQIAPPHRGAMGYHPGRLVDEEHRDSAESLLQEVTLVMVPKSPLDEDGADWLKRHYWAAIARDFKEVDESKLWVLYQKRDDSKAMR